MSEFRGPSVEELVGKGLSAADPEMALLKQARRIRNERATELGIDLDRPPVEKSLSPMELLRNNIVQAFRGKRVA